MGCTSSSAGQASGPGSAPAAAGKTGAAAGTKAASKDLIEVSYFGTFGPLPNPPYARVDPFKQMLSHAGANWKFNGIKDTEWAAVKASGNTGEFGAMPFVKQGGQTYDLSIPALRRLAQQFGYYPANDWKKATTVDMIAETYSDAFNALTGPFANPALSDAEKGEKVVATIGETGICTKFFNLVDAALARNGNGKYLVGNQLTYADFCLTSFIFNHFKNDQFPVVSVIGPWLSKNYPRVDAYAEELRAANKKHLDSRLPAPF